MGGGSPGPRGDKTQVGLASWCSTEAGAGGGATGKVRDIVGSREGVQVCQGLGRTSQGLLVCLKTGVEREKESRLETVHCVTEEMTLRGASLARLSQAISMYPSDCDFQMHKPFSCSGNL